MMKRAFVDELEKIGASMKSLNVPKGRVGRRSISVANFLKKDNEDRLFRKRAFVVGVEQGPTDPAVAKKGKTKGEVPSRDDAEITRREDGRDSATNVTGPATLFSDVATVGGS